MVFLNALSGELKFNFGCALSTIADAQRNCRSLHPISTLIGRRRPGFSNLTLNCLITFSRAHLRGGYSRHVDTNLAETAVN